MPVGLLREVGFGLMRPKGLPERQEVVKVGFVGVPAVLCCPRDLLPGLPQPEGLQLFGRRDFQERHRPD